MRCCRHRAAQHATAVQEPQPARLPLKPPRAATTINIWAKFAFYVLRVEELSRLWKCTFDKISLAWLKRLWACIGRDLNQLKKLSSDASKKRPVP